MELLSKEESNAEDRDTQLLSSEAASERARGQKSSKPRPVRARPVLLAALLAVGILASFVTVRYLAAPVDGVPQADAVGDLRAGMDQQPVQAGGEEAAGQEEDAGHAGHGDAAGSNAEVQPITLDTMEEELGIRITRLTLIAGGSLVDLRFQVTGTAKASGVLDPAQQVYLLNEGSGKSVSTAHFPKIGSMRPRHWMGGALASMW